MRVITQKPIIQDMSNCCGKSNADGMPIQGRFRKKRKVSLVRDDFAGRPVIIQQKSGFDSYSNMSNTSTPKFGGATPNTSSIGQQAKDFLSSQKSARKESRGKAVSDILLGAETRAETRRGAREVRRAERLTQKEARQSERIENRKARAQRRSDRKKKRNAQKLLLIQRTRTSEPKFFFPLQKLRLSKRKKGAYTKTYPDGSEMDIDRSKTVTDENGNVYSSEDFAKTTNTPPPMVEGKTFNSQTGFTDPTTGQTYETTNVRDSQGNPTLGLEANDEKISGAADGSVYLTDDLQGSNETEKDVKDDDKNKEAEAKGLTKTQKWVLGIGAAVVVGLVVYALVKNKKPSTGTAASSTGGATLSKVA